MKLSGTVISPDLPGFRDVECRFLIIRLHRLNPTRIDIAVAIHLIPSRIERITIFTLLHYSGDIHHLIRSKMWSLLAANAGAS